MTPVTSGMFGGGGGACPICGAPNATCKSGDTPAPIKQRPNENYVTAEDGTVTVLRRHAYRLGKSRWRSAARVTAPIGEKRLELRYAPRDFIPLIVALKQGLVTTKQITEADKEEIRAHVASGHLTVEDLRGYLEVAKKKAAKSPPADKMLRESQVVQK